MKFRDMENKNWENFTVRNFNNIKFWTGNPNTWKWWWSDGVQPPSDDLSDPSGLLSTIP